jgi:dihydrofolate reductase
MARPGAVGVSDDRPLSTASRNRAADDTVEDMGKLIYLMNVSLDGFVETPDHSLDWSITDEEVLGWFNEHERSIDASLYGRRMYELMNAYWPTAESDPAGTPATHEYARLWNATPKIVFSRTIHEVEGNSRLATGGPADELERVRREFSGDIEVSGPTLASEFVRRGLVDEYRLVVHPVILGAGTPYFPGFERPVGLRLDDVHRFASGVVYLGYSVR